MEILANKEYVYKKGKFSQGQRWSRDESLEQVELLKVILQSFGMVEVLVKFTPIVRTPN
jgi:hypothetical protein